MKRVAQELGGKAPAIVLPGADLGVAATKIAEHAFANSGQSCTAATRMLVQADLEQEVLGHLVRIADAKVVGDPTNDATELGPLVSEAQFAKVNGMIADAITAGARLACGGPGRPANLIRGYYVRPTVLTGVTPNMPIAREEVFGPVLVVMTFRDVAEAVEMANDSAYGLAAYVLGPPEDAWVVARRLEAGCILINKAEPAFDMPFGGYKQSGNGKEMGVFGFEEFLELKALVEQAA